MELNINRDDPATNDFITIHAKYKSLPNKVFIHDTFSGDKFEEILKDYKSKGISNTISEYLPNSTGGYIMNKKVLIELSGNIFCSYLGIDIESETFIIEEVVFYFKDPEDEEIVKEITAIIIEHTISSETKIPRINTLSVDSGTLDIHPVHCEEIDIKKNYNKETREEIKGLIKKINSVNSGLSIIHGSRGVGKTKLLNHIVMNSNRTSIYIPTNMIDLSINSPEFKDFLQKYDYPLLIIDDLEFITNSQVSHMNYFASNLIQLVDGFLSDNIQIIVMMNEVSERELDKNLINCNSLMDIINIKKLNNKKATKLSKNLGLNIKYKEKTLLKDVYNGKTSKISKIGL